MTIKTKYNRGFTLVELILYLGVMSLIVVMVSVLMTMIVGGRVKSQSLAEVEQQGAQAMQIITQTIKNASSITTPAQGIAGASLALVVPDAAKSPTIFDLSSGVLRIKEGTGAVIALTNANITVSNLSFHNLTRNSTKGTIRIQFDATRKNPDNRNEYNYTETFYGTGTLK